MSEIIRTHGPYGIYLFLLLLGLFTVMFGRHLIRKLIGLTLIQTSVILFWILLSIKSGATVPILSGHLETVHANLYANPLPHTLMLTAIVVGISTTGVSLALIIMIHRRYQTLEEDKILERML